MKTYVLMPTNWLMYVMKLKYNLLSTTHCTVNYITPTKTGLPSHQVCAVPVST